MAATWTQRGAPPRPAPLRRRVLAQLRDPLIMVLLGAAP
ncbi:hypothetical protein [Streptomyces sp. NBC_00454]